MKGYIFDVYKKHIENGRPKSAARFFAAVEFNRKFNPV